MIDSRRLSSGRDDLVVDVSRCLRMRFSESSCRSCVDICPHDAVNLGDGLSIHPQHCRGCLLCTAVCPVGALEQANDFSNCLAQLSRVPDAVLGCSCTTDSSNATIACLGGLSEEHLAMLCCTLTTPLTLNCTVCSDCPNGIIVQHLKRRVAAVSDLLLIQSGCRIVIAETLQDINCRSESLDRRSFFRSFRSSLFASAAVILSADSQLPERRTEYAGKRVPLRREMLNRARTKLSSEQGQRMRKQFDSSVSFAESCTRCQGCVAICPTGALRAKSIDEPPVFDQHLCTGCELCREFCADGALLFSSEDSRRDTTDSCE